MLAVLLTFFEFVLLSSGIQETNGQQRNNVSKEIHTTFNLPCSCSISPERTNLVQWYGISKTGTFTGDERAIAWWGGGTKGNSPGFGINDDFSMVVHRANLTNRALYRCIVTPVGGSAERTCDVKLDVYANPYSSPVMKYIHQGNEINVTCSVSHVFPLAFPNLTLHEGNGTANINEDGTYNTTVSHLFPLGETDAIIRCHFFNANFKSMSSLLITDYVDQPVNETHGPKNGSGEDHVPKNGSDPNSNRRCTLSRLPMVWVTLILEFPLLIIIVYLMRTALNFNNSTVHKMEEINRDNERPVSQRRTTVKFKRFVFGGKIFFAAITLTIQFTVIILLVSYLATVNCAYEE